MHIGGRWRQTKAITCISLSSIVFILRNTLINCCVVNVVRDEVRGRNTEACFSKLTLLMEKWERIIKLNKEESPQ